MIFQFNRKERTNQVARRQSGEKARERIRTWKRDLRSTCVISREVHTSSLGRIDSHLAVTLLRLFLRLRLRRLRRWCEQAIYGLSCHFTSIREFLDGSLANLRLCDTERMTSSRGGGGLPYMGYIGMCGPKGYGFSAVLVINRVPIFAL